MHAHHELRFTCSKQDANNLLPSSELLAAGAAPYLPEADRAAMGLVRASGGEEEVHTHHELRFTAYEAPQTRATQAAAQPVLAAAPQQQGAVISKLCSGQTASVGITQPAPYQAGVSQQFFTTSAAHLDLPWPPVPAPAPPSSLTVNFAAQASSAPQNWWHLSLA